MNLVCAQGYANGICCFLNQFAQFGNSLAGDDDPSHAAGPIGQGHFKAGQTVAIDAALVDARLGELAKNEDLSRYIL